MSEPRWLTRARGYIGTREIKGPKHNPLILSWWQKIKSSIRDDESPWCAAGVGGVLEEEGIVSSRKASARSYQSWGEKLHAAALGAVVVFWRGSPTGWSGHVGFVAGRDRFGNLMVLGFNQGDECNIKPFLPDGAKGHRVLGFYWPAGVSEVPDFDLPLLNSDGRLSANEA